MRGDRGLSTGGKASGGSQNLQKLCERLWRPHMDVIHYFWMSSEKERTECLFIWTGKPGKKSHVSQAIYEIPLMKPRITGA